MQSIPFQSLSLFTETPVIMQHLGRCVKARLTWIPCQASQDIQISACGISRSHCPPSTPSASSPHARGASVGPTTGALLAQRDENFHRTFIIFAHRDVAVGEP